MTGEDWQDFGLCYTGGVNHIEYVTSMLDLGNRKYFILSDADQRAKQKRREMGKPEYWYTYSDLDSQSVTIEDFYKKEFFLEIVNEVLQKNNITVADDELFQEDDRINTIKRILGEKKIGTKKINTVTINKIVVDIKDICIERFESININKEKVEKVLEAFLEKINSNQLSN